MTTNFIEQIKEDLKSFASTSPLDAAKNLLSRLGVRYSTVTDDPIDIGELYKKAAASVKAEIPKSVKAVFDRIETSWFLGGVSEETFVGTETQTSFETASEKAGDQKHNGMFIFLLRMKDGAPLTRTDAAQLTRGINRVMKSKPATVFIVEGQGDKTLLSIATCERTTYKQDWRPGEKLGRVSILKGIDCSDPHRGHLDILASMDVKKCKTFDALYAQWQKVFSTSILTNKFYRELFAWYCWAIDKKSGVYFPNRPDDKTDDYEGIDTKMIRLITRVMFVWFIKQKDLVPEQLFKVDELKKILKDFDPLATDSGCYYNAILQNLFFATLNRAIEDEDGKRRFAEAKNQVDAKNLYRYDEMFSISRDEIVKLFAEVPFVNGSLFDCLDKTKGNDGVDKAYYADGFSRNDKVVEQTHHFKYRAFVPNRLFFDPERGLFSIFERYAFTVEENTPLEQQVALDPELLGKVFENLLGVYNGETTREKSGSFYTPREIVEYMVDEVLIAYLGDTPFDRSLFASDFKYQSVDAQRYDDVIHKLKQVKVLDPACGSGAFPVGMLNRMVEIIQRLQGADTATPEALYKLKKYIIENCLYGSDIQCIAAQITRLRFFISLIVNCEKDLTKPNFGIPELPNLETKFVAANSLLGIKKMIQGDLWTGQEVSELKDKLHQVRHDHFNARSARRKRELVRKDDKLRRQLLNVINGHLFSNPEDAWQLANWDPYDQNASAGFFEPKWMFSDVQDGFDIVIGNPPYVSTKGRTDKDKDLLEKEYGFADDLYFHFIIRGFGLLKHGGVQSLITSDTYFTTAMKTGLRKLMLGNELVRLVHWGHGIFDSAMVSTATFISRKAVPSPDFKSVIVDMKGRTALAEREVYEVDEDVYRHSINGAIFIPSKLNVQINERFLPLHDTLLRTWWDRIKTSREISKNAHELQRYRDSLKPGDLTLVGLVTEGGQGLATGDNGLYVGVREGTKAAANVRLSRVGKLEEFNKAHKTSYTIPTDEQKIWDLFDGIKAKYGRRAFGKGILYRIVPDSMCVDLSTLSEKTIKEGFSGKNRFVPYDKGDKDGNRWYLETPYVIDWSRESVGRLEADSNARFQNTQFYFREGFCYSDIKTFFIRCRMKGVSIHDVKSMSLFPISEALPYYYLITVINSHLTATIVYNFLNNTPSFQINDCRMLPILVPTKEQLDECKRLFDAAVAIQREYFSKKVPCEARDKELQCVQDKVDAFVYRLYGIDTTAYLSHSNTVYDVTSVSLTTDEEDQLE